MSLCLLLGATLVLVGRAEAAGNIGCLFSNTLCENEWCFDDYAFGRCFPVKANLKEDDLTRYHLGEDELHVLEAEMQRLYHLGYRWSHTYTQCVLQALLKAIHESTEFDVTSCNDELDQDLEGALRAIEGEEQEAVRPRDLAIVRFTPSATDPHSDYADEFYFPAIEGGKLLPAPFRELPSLDGDKLPQSDLKNSTSVKAAQGQSQKAINDVLFNDTPDSSLKSKEKPHDLKTVPGGSNVKVAKPFYGGKADRPAVKASAGNAGSSPLKSVNTPKISFNSHPFSSNYFDVSPMDRQLMSGVNFQKSSPYDFSGMQRDEYLRNKIYPKNPYPGNAAQFAPQSKEYLVDPGYSMDGFLSDGLYPGNGFMGDQPILDDAPEEPEVDFLNRGLSSTFPTKPRKMSNKEYLKQHLNFPVRDYEEYEDIGYDPAYEKSLYGGRSNNHNPLYKKRSKSQRFNLRNFLNEFNDYVKAEREKTMQSKKDMRSRTAANASNVASDDALFPGHIDPELRKDFMSFAEDVMRKDRYGDVKPQYNTAELKKLAAIIDELRTMQQGPHDGSPLPRPLDRTELQPVYAKPLAQRGKTNGGAESSQNEIADYYPDTNNGAYLRVDKAIPYGSPSRYPVHPRPHIDRYAYAPYTDDFKQAEGTYLGSQETAGGEQGYYHQGQVPPTDLYYKGQQPETFYPAYGPAYDYHRNSIDSQFPDTPVPLDEDPYDAFKDGFDSQTKYPFFYMPEGPMYDYPMYDYATTLDGSAPSASDDPDSSNFVKKDEETADSEYGTIMGAEGKPLPYNFERPERVDVKKPGPNFYPNPYAFHDNAPVYYYEPNYDLGPYPGGGKMYDHYPPYGYLYNDPYPNYDMDDVDTVGGTDSAEGAPEGNYPNDAGDLKGDQRVRYRDANGNAIDIGLATGRGGMIPMEQDSESVRAHFSKLLRKQGLKGSTLHPGTNSDRLMRLHHPAHLPDLLLTEEMVVDNVSKGLANQHHAKMMNRPHGVHPARLTMDMGQGRPNQSSTEGEGVTHAASLPPPSPTYVYVDVNMSFSSLGEASDLASLILHNAGLSRADIQDLRVEDNRMLFTLRDNLKGVSEQDIADKAQELAPSIQRDWNVLITRAGVASSQGEGWSVVEGSGSERRLMVGAAVVSGVMAAAVVAAAGVLLLRRHAAHRNKIRGFTNRDSEASKDYQDLCRARMAAKNKSVHSGGSGAGDKDGSAGGNVAGTHAASKPRIASLSKESDNGGNSPGSRSSTSSWSEEPVAPNMDISTGHMVLSYMEDHLQNKSRLDQEWVALCAYEAEPSATMVAKKPTNQKKNRYPAVLPYDHNRVHLNQQANISGSDYINASSITDHDPRNPAYIATQGPLATTTADFWQLVWEQGSVVIVMLTKLNENGHTLCHHYWPQEGSQLYHIYEVHLVSEHIWCDDYLVRSFYLKNTRTGETRTVTQFHFLSWPDTAIPVSTKALLEFRRKVNKSYRGRSCPIIVHCSDGIGRSGTYILIDMVLNRMAKGAKEIDIAATLEHIRDQRANMVATKLQFEFVLMAVAEEVHAILKALPQ